jgi:guanylate kinase
MILIVGASASGKTVIGKYLIDTYHFKKFVTSTTRPMRIGEKQNIDYHFLTDKEFDEKIKNNEFIEYTTYNGYMYGSERKEIGTNKILIVEPNGLNAYIALKDRTIITFFIKCDENVRKERMILRNDDPKEIKKRLKNDALLFTNSLENDVDYTIDSSFTKKEEIGDKIYKLYLTKVTASN